VFGDEVARRYVGRGVAQLGAVWKKYREHCECMRELEGTSG